MAKIIVNGEAQEVQLPLNLAALSKQNDVQQPDMVSVQVNVHGRRSGFSLEFKVESYD